MQERVREEAESMLERELDVFMDLSKEACRNNMKDSSGNLGYALAKYTLMMLERPEARDLMAAALITVQGNIKFDSRWDE